jgi:hypothetical protein
MGELAGMRMGAVTLTDILPGTNGSVWFAPTREVPLLGIGYGAVEFSLAELLLTTSDMTVDAEL